MTFSEYTKQVSDISNQLEKNAQELQVLEVKDDCAKAAEEMQATKVSTSSNYNFSTVDTVNSPVPMS